MRVVLAALAALAASACTTYDPIDGVSFREFATTRGAIAAILEDVGPQRVYAVGEYHPTSALVGRSPMAQFVSDVLPLLPAEDVLLEAWPDPSCSRSDPAQQQVAAVAQRPIETNPTATTTFGPHHRLYGLSITCIEHSAMLDPRGRVDFLRLLAMVSDKLRDRARDLLADRKTLVIYGGALHNDLYPQWLLDELSYGHQLVSQSVPVVEIDLVSPEVVRQVRSLWSQPWFPLVERAASDRAMVWERGLNSYVVILPD